MIRFVNNINEIPDYPSSRVVLIDDTLLSEQAVIDRIEKALDASYEKDNWDGFRDAITDLSWLDCSSVGRSASGHRSVSPRSPRRTDKTRGKNALRKTG